ncbi:MAG: DMT family transporter [Rhodobacteraceae bacterium]|nr:DMT family transporter [Paracoccaceae bacterium]
MAFPIHELAALGTATCWATTGILASDAIRALGAFHFNLLRQMLVTLILAGVVLASGTLALPGWEGVLVLAVSGVVGILMGDTLNFAAVGRLGPRRAGAIFALNAPMAAILGFGLLGERLGLQDRARWLCATLTWLGDEGDCDPDNGCCANGYEKTTGENGPPRPCRCCASLAAHMQHRLVHIALVVPDYDEAPSPLF